VLNSGNHSLYVLDFGFLGFFLNRMIIVTLHNRLCLWDSSRLL